MKIIIRFLLPPVHHTAERPNKNIGWHSMCSDWNVTHWFASRLNGITPGVELTVLDHGQSNYAAEFGIQIWEAVHRGEQPQVQ